MSKPPLPLTALSEAQRTQANARFAIIRPILEEGITQAQVARTYDLPKSTVQRWVKNSREKGEAILANASRSDKGKSRHLPDQAVGLIERLADHSPPQSLCLHSSPSGRNRRRARVETAQLWSCSSNHQDL